MCHPIQPVVIRSAFDVSKILSKRLNFFPPSYQGEIVNKISIFLEFLVFLKERKKYWLAPIVIMLILLSALIVLTEGSAVAPFIYTLF